MSAPWATHRTSYGVGRVDALALIVDPAVDLRIDLGRTAAALGLTRADGRMVGLEVFDGQVEVVDSATN